MKKLSVIVAAFRAQDYIGEMINSFKAQIPTKGWEYELVIGVDACDMTADTLNTLDAPYYLSEANVGAYIIRNSLIANTEADIYTIFDADDIMYPHKLTTIISHIGHTGVVASSKHRMVSNTLAGTVAPYGGGILSFTEHVWGHVKGYKSDRIAADTDLTIRMVLSGHPPVEILEPTYIYRVTAQSLTQTAATSIKSEARCKIMQRHNDERMAGNISVPIPAYMDLKLRNGSDDTYDYRGMGVSVIIFAPGPEEDKYRQRNYNHILSVWAGKADEIISVSVDDNSFYNKSLLLKAAVQSTSVSTDILVVTDADVICDPLYISRSITNIKSGKCQWATPNNLVHRMTPEESNVYLRGSIPTNFKKQAYRGQDMGGLFVISKSFLESTGGFDPRFQGWGGEDAAYSIVAQAFGIGYTPGKPVNLWHLWHPESNTKVPGQMKSLNPKNMQLFSEYESKKGLKEQLKSLISNRFANAAEWLTDENIKPIDKSYTIHKGDAAIMQIKITKSVITSHGIRHIDAVLDVSDFEGKLLISLSKAEEIDKAPEVADYKEATDIGKQRDVEAVKSVPRKRRSKKNVTNAD